MRSTSFAAFLVCLLVSTMPLLETEAKVFTHCELAQELRRLQIPESQIATWVCIAHYESRLNSSAISQTGDHGIFQISEEYWCSHSGRGKGCGLSCAELQDDDISDDVDCVQTIFDEHQGLSGNGFNAWAAYPRCKKSSTANRFLKKCTSGSVDNSIDSVDTQLELRGENPSSLSPPQRSSSSIKPSYFQDHSFAPHYTPVQSFTKVSYSPFQDFSQPGYSAVQGFGKQSYSQHYINKPFSVAKTSVSPLSQGYDSFTRTSPIIYTTRRPLTPVVSSSTVSPPTAIKQYSPSIYSPSRPSSYSVGSVYYNPFETKSTIPAPVQYSLSPKTSYSTSIFDNRRTISGFQSTSAPPVYKSYTRSDTAQVKTSSSVPTYKIKAPWADFPWWNGGK